MLKCNGKFCSFPEIKSDEDVVRCNAKNIHHRPGWKGKCFYQRDGGGCEECGGRVIRASACKICVVCGASSCG